MQVIIHDEIKHLNSDSAIITEKENIVNKYKNIILSSLLLFGASSAQAVPITGTMEMGGSFIALDRLGNATTAASAVAIDFNFFGLDKFVVNAGDGDFSGLAGSYGDIKDFTFDPFVAPIADFWSIAGFSFELTDVVRGVSGDPASFLILNGVGTISALGFDDTAANWWFSGDTTGTGTFSWSATSAVAVPEPGLLLLLSMGLIGFGLRKKLINR